jgi:hypothetical protein
MESKAVSSMSLDFMAVFLKLWSAGHQWSTAVGQMGSEEKALKKFYQILNK